jgi:transcriptional regulator with XRE-family HTH domain
MPITFQDAARAQVRQSQQRHGWTQAQLGKAIARFGGTSRRGNAFDRTHIAKIETGEREISLEEALLLALALDMAPVHLLVPTDGDEPVQITPNFNCPPADARAWICWKYALPSQDRRMYDLQAPEDWYLARLRGEER